MFFGLSLHASVQQEDKTVLIAILARNKAHFLPRFLECIKSLDYNKKLITLYINTNNNDDNTQEVLERWVEANGDQYSGVIFEKHHVQSLQQTDPHDWTPVRFKVLGTIRNQSMQKAKDAHCDYYFIVDCDNFITPCTLKELLLKNKPIIAPMLRAIPNATDMYSNYFCAINPAGYYAGHPDYPKILYREMIGTFKEPVVHCTYLIQTSCIDKLGYVDGTDDYEFVIFSRMARNNGIDQYICNEKDFGVLWHCTGTESLAEERAKFLEYSSTQK